MTGIDRDIRTKSRSPAREGPDARIAALAERQHGVVARRQLAALGVGPDAVQRRLAAKRLHRVHRGVYAVGHVRLPPLGRWMAAVLACGPEALLSHLCAAALWHLLAYTGPRAHVTVPRGRGGPPGIAVHEARRLASADRAVRDGIPVTSVARTLLDLAATLPRDRLERAVEQADRLRLLDVRAVADVCERARGHRGAPPLRALLAELRPAPDVRSELERRFLAVVRDARLPPPATNVSVAGHEVDAAWLERRLVVELDGHAFHSSRAAFERDRARDADLQLAGYRVVRFTARRVEREPETVAATVRALLSAAAPA